MLARRPLQFLPGLRSLIFELEDVSYRAGGSTILDHVDWSVARGENWAVLGPNGSGKTTLLRIACGFLWATDGTARRLGKELIDLGELRRRIGWISSDLVGKIPVREPARDTVVAGRFAQVGFKDLPSLQPTDADRDEALEQLAKLGAAQLGDRPFGVLSQGEKQKVLIARARMAEPLLLVLDEPCAGMDPGAREQLLSALSSLAAEPDGPAIVLVTHHVEEIMPEFTKTLVLRAGRIVANGTSQEILTPDVIEQTYNVAVDRLESAGGRLFPIWR